MRRTKLAVVVSALVLFAAAPRGRADQAAPQKELQTLNAITGVEPMQGALKALLDDHKNAKDVIAKALPAAKKKEGLSYNAAFLLALASADLKDLKTSEVFFRVCMDQAAKLQSVRKLAQSYGTLIELYYDNKQYADAARVCKELIDLKTDDGKARVVNQAFTDEKGETDFTEFTEFDAARRIRPMVQQTLVKAMAKQGKHDAALKLVDNLLKEQDDYEERHLKAWVLREAGQGEKAAGVIEDLLKKLARDTDVEEKLKDNFQERLRYELSNIYVDLNKIDRATEQLEQLVKKRPNEPGYYNDLGYILADHDMKLDEAENMIRKALELDRVKRAKAGVKDEPENGAYLDSLGWVLYKKKNYAEAKKYLLQAIEDKSAQHIEIYDHLADVHMALGERDAAIRAWQKGLEAVGDTRRDQERKAAVEKKLKEAKSSEAKSASK